MKKFLIVLFLVIFCLFLYAKYVETGSLKINEYTITNDLIPASFDGYKIAHFSDVLYDGDVDKLSKIAEEINISKPDVIVFTGDLIKNKINDEDKKELSDFLSKLEAKDFKFFITGDNDNNEVVQMFENAQFINLDNTSKLVYHNGNTPIEFGNNEEINNLYKIRLIHKPDEYATLKDKYSLVLAGHSLAGQIRLPFWGALIKENGAQNYSDYHYVSGNSEMYVSNGIGNHNLNLRIFNKSSVNIYRLYSK